MRWNWAAWIAAMVLCACGGGGGSGPSGPSGPVTRTALAALSQDINPGGERLDYRDRESGQFQGLRYSFQVVHEREATHAGQLIHQ